MAKRKKLVANQKGDSLIHVDAVSLEELAEASLNVKKEDPSNPEDVIAANVIDSGEVELEEKDASKPNGRKARNKDSK